MLTDVRNVRADTQQSVQDLHGKIDVRMNALRDEVSANARSIRLEVPAVFAAPVAKHFVVTQVPEEANAMRASVQDADLMKVSADIRALRVVCERAVPVDLAPVLAPAAEGFEQGDEGSKGKGMRK